MPGVRIEPARVVGVDPVAVLPLLERVKTFPSSLHGPTGESATKIGVELPAM